MKSKIRQFNSAKIVNRLVPASSELAKSSDQISVQSETPAKKYETILYEGPVHRTQLSEYDKKSEKDFNEQQNGVPGNEIQIKRRANTYSVRQTSVKDQEIGPKITKFQINPKYSIDVSNQYYKKGDKFGEDITTKKKAYQQYIFSSNQPNKDPKKKTIERPKFCGSKNIGTYEFITLSKGGTSEDTLTKKWSTDVNKNQKIESPALVHENVKTTKNVQTFPFFGEHIRSTQKKCQQVKHINVEKDKQLKAQQRIVAIREQYQNIIKIKQNDFTKEKLQVIRHFQGQLSKKQNEIQTLKKLSQNQRSQYFLKCRQLQTQYISQLSRKNMQAESFQKLLNQEKLIKLEKINEISQKNQIIKNLSTNLQTLQKNLRIEQQKTKNYIGQIEANNILKNKQIEACKIQIDRLIEVQKSMKYKTEGLERSILSLNQYLQQQKQKNKQLEDQMKVNLEQNQKLSSDNQENQKLQEQIIQMRQIIHEYSVEHKTMLDDYLQILEIFGIEADTDADIHKILMKTIFSFTEKFSDLVNKTDKLENQIDESRHKSKILYDEKKKLNKQVKSYEKMIESMCHRTSQLQIKMETQFQHTINLQNLLSDSIEEMVLWNMNSLNQKYKKITEQQNNLEEEEEESFAR